MVKKAAQATPNHLLRVARQERGWTQQDVADRIGAPHSLNISRWESGTAFPRGHYIQQLCLLFEKSAGALGLIQREDALIHQETWLVSNKTEVPAPTTRESAEPPSTPLPASRDAPLSPRPLITSELPGTAVGELERRLVTVLSCDLSGFTLLWERLDPEDVREIQGMYFGRMSREKGRFGGVIEEYAEEAVLALFGVPVAHEDDAERAVRCGLSM